MINKLWALKDSPGAKPPKFPVLPPPANPWAAMLCRYVPAIDSLRSYSFRSLGADIFAGLTVATVAVPQAMAYAMLAGLPPQYGLYTAIVMTAVGAVLDSSRQLINGPTNAISIALLSALAVIPEADRTSAAVFFALLVGLIQMGITLLRLGDLTRFVSHAVIVGFTLGAGILLVLDQIKHLLGLPNGGNAGDHFLKRVWLSMTSGTRLHAPTVLVGIGTIILILAGRKLNGWLKKKDVRFLIPQHLVAIIIIGLIVWAFGLDELGVKTVGEDTGKIPAALPPFSIPNSSWENIRLMTGNAFGVAILGLLEAIAMAKAIATRTGQKLDINQQCLSEGMANIAGSFFQCMPGSGSLTRSTVNRQAGAVSQWSGVFSAMAVAATLVLFAGLASHIPRASLAGLLMLAAFRMVDHRQLVFHLRATRFDALIVIATALAAVFVSIELCILIGVFLSFVLYVPRAAQVQLVELVLATDGQTRESATTDSRCDRMLLYNLEGDLSFGTAPEMETHLAAIERRAGQNCKVVLLSLKQARNPDAAFLSLLREFLIRLRIQGVELILTGVRHDLAKALHSSRLFAQIGQANIFTEADRGSAGMQDAIRRSYEIVGSDICSTCPRGNAPLAVSAAL